MNILGWILLGLACLVVPVAVAVAALLNSCGRALDRMDEYRGEIG